MAALPEPVEPTVHIQPMRRRHVRSVLKIEQEVYPRPWSGSLFLSELALRSTRAYYIARIGLLRCLVFCSRYCCCRS